MFNLLASCFYNSQESCGSFVGCLSESFSADCHRTKYDSRNDLCPASTHSIAIDSPPSVFLVQSGVASCSSLLLPFLGFGFCLTSYLSISHLSLCEWPDIRLWAQTRCPLCGSSATTQAAAPGDSLATAPDTATTAKQHAKRHAKQYARQHTTQHASPYKIDRRRAREPVNGLQRLARLGSLQRLARSGRLITTDCVPRTLHLRSWRLA